MSRLRLTLGLRHLFLLAVLPACRRTPGKPGAQSSPRAARCRERARRNPGPPAPETQAAVQGVLDAARHPWLRWPTVSHGLPALRRLYAPEAEPDGLFWFTEGSTPYPELADRGRDGIGKAQKKKASIPRLRRGGASTSEWKRISAPGATLTDRGLFDIALTTQARYAYISRRPHTAASTHSSVGLRLRRQPQAPRPRGGAAGTPRGGRPSSRPGRTRSLPSPSITGSSRPSPNTARSPRRASRRSLPKLQAKQKKVEPGQPWAGARRSRRGSRVPRPPADAASGAAPSARPSTRARSSSGEGVPGPPRAGARRCHRRRHDRDAQRPSRTASARSSWRWSASAGCRR